MNNVARAIVRHELLERSRDRWVVMVTFLFMLLSVGITSYGKASQDYAAIIIGPSLVTLVAFLVPLIGLVLGHDAIVGEKERHTLGLILSLPVSRGKVLLSKFIGRLLALGLAILLGLSSACLFLETSQWWTIMELIPQTLLLGAAFLSIGISVSSFSDSVATSATMCVALWFLLVFIYDLVLLSALVAMDGAISQEVIAWAVFLNPAGLFRSCLMVEMIGESTMVELGQSASLPHIGLISAIWTGWVIMPLLVGSFRLRRGI
jgi:Cu-processing system permease protein